MSTQFIYSFSEVIALVEKQINFTNIDDDYADNDPLHASLLFATIVRSIYFFGSTTFQTKLYQKHETTER
jgi:hypothetical protein